MTEYVDAAIEYVEEIQMKEMEDEIDRQVLEIEKEGEMKGKTKQDGSGKGTRANKGRGGCAKPRSTGKGRR